MHNLSISELINALQTRKISAYELVNHYLARIKKYQHLNAFINIDEEYATQKAKNADKLLKEKNCPTLTGIPLAHKDVFCTTRLPTTCASKMLENYTSPFDATIVKKLNENGAIMLGKTNMDEFAMGATGETSYFGTTLNPWNTSHVAGGSSSGSVAAVAARLVPFATTTDTGGSTRQPAAFCSLSGIKPTYGLISRFGQVAYASSFDQAGIVTNNVEDLAITMQVIAGFDKNDSTSINKPVANFTKDLYKPIAGIRVGIPSNLFNTIEINPDIKQATLDAIDILEKQGANIVEIDIKLINSWLPCYTILTSSEVSSNLSRYDGIRFGYRAKIYKNIEELIINSRSESLGLETKKRIITGTYLLSDKNFNDYYLQAQRVRRLITNELTTLLKQVDVILTPTTPATAYKVGESATLPQYKNSDIFTVGANLSGLPAISIPGGFSKNSMPIGIQFTGNYLNEPLLFQIANSYQQHTNWHKKTPFIGDKE